MSGQLNVESYCLIEQGVHLWADLSRGKLQHLAASRGVLDDRAGDRVLFVSDADLAEDFEEYRTLLDERGDDMAFFQQRVDQGCIERLEKFVEASFERMDYTDAIAHLDKAVAKGSVEFP